MGFACGSSLGCSAAASLSAFTPILLSVDIPFKCRTLLSLGILSGHVSRQVAIWPLERSGYSINHLGFEAFPTLPNRQHTASRQWPRFHGLTYNQHNSPEICFIATSELPYNLSSPAGSCASICADGTHRGCRSIAVPHSVVTSPSRRHAAQWVLDLYSMTVPAMSF